MFCGAVSVANQRVSVGGLADCLIIADIFKQEKGIYIDMCICAHVFWPRLKPAWQDRQERPETHLCATRIQSRTLGGLGHDIPSRVATCYVPTQTANE
jgi:hypothetical protein